MKQPLANGIRTDHPVQGLPFVDDSLLDLDDGPAIEAIGREKGSGRWGRFDELHDVRLGWVAFATDPEHLDLGWLVRSHPVFGRSVSVYRDIDLSSLHSWFMELGAVCFDFGGYWYDGESWFRPPQLFDSAREEYARAEVPQARTRMTAEVSPRVVPTPDEVGLVDLARLPVQIAADDWAIHLALWRGKRENDQGCVLGMDAPEVQAAELVTGERIRAMSGLDEWSFRQEWAGSSTPPQAIVDTVEYWSLPVAREWVRGRQFSAEAIEKRLSVAGYGARQSVGRKKLTDLMAELALGRLEDFPPLSRLVGRHPIPAKLVDSSRDLAVNLESLVPSALPSLWDQGAVLREAILNEMNRWIETHPDMSAVAPLGLQLERVLCWLFDWSPSTLVSLIGDMLGEAERRSGVPPEYSARTIRRSLTLGGNDEGAIDTLMTPFEMFDFRAELPSSFRWMGAARSAGVLKSNVRVSDQNWSDFVKRIRSWCLAVEDQAQSFNGLDEYQLRDSLLAGLRMTYSVTFGEVMTRGLKSDICVRPDRGSPDEVPMIVELKFWNGAKGLQGDLRQHLDQLTTRQPRGALLYFVKAKSMNDIKEKLCGAVEAAADFQRWVPEQDVAGWPAARFISTADTESYVDVNFATVHLGAAT